jgi:hypothetical protein
MGVPGQVSKQSMPSNSGQAALPFTSVRWNSQNGTNCSQSLPSSRNPSVPKNVAVYDPKIFGNLHPEREFASSPSTNMATKTQLPRAKTPVTSMKSTDTGHAAPLQTQSTMFSVFEHACADDIVHNVPAKSIAANGLTGFANFSGPQRADFSTCIGLSTNAVPKRNRDEGAVNSSDDDAPICAHVAAVHVETLRGSKQALPRLSNSIFAKDFGISEARVSQLIAEGMPDYSLEDAKAWRKTKIKKSSKASSTAAFNDIVLPEVVISPAMDLRLNSRLLSGPNSICPVLMDLIFEGIDCWGKFYKTLRPWESRVLMSTDFGRLTHDEYIARVLAIYKRYHKDRVTSMTNTQVIQDLRQTVMREKKHREGVASVVIIDKSSPAYIDHLASIRNDAASVKAGSADDQQARRVQLKAQTSREYTDCTAFCRVNEQLDPKFFKESIPDDYKGGHRRAQNQADISAERTQDKVEARRLLVQQQGLGDQLYDSATVNSIVAELTPIVEGSMQSHMLYLGATMYDEDGQGFSEEVVRFASMDGGCQPAFTLKQGPEITSSSGRMLLHSVGFQFKVLHKSRLYCNIRRIETAIHTKLKMHTNRLWHISGSGSYRNRPDEIREQLDLCRISSLFITFAPLTIMHRLSFHPNLPLCALALQQSAAAAVIAAAVRAAAAAAAAAAMLSDATAAAARIPDAAAVASAAAAASAPPPMATALTALESASYKH